MVALHQGITRLVCHTNYVQINSDDVFIQSTPTAFDGATFDIWGPLLNGARLVMAPGIIHDLHQLAQAYERYQVTAAWLTSPIFSLMVRDYLPAMKSLRYCLAGGDVVSAEYVKRFTEAYPQSTFINGYGPTENTTFSSCHLVQHGDEIGQSVSIGQPIGNSTCYVLNDNMQPVAVGVPGELYVGGMGVAGYYQNQAAMTAERFVPDPFGSPGSRLYRTGDLVRLNMKGQIDFIGRRDEQVKVRGYRIELDEVNQALESLEGVAHSVASVCSDAQGHKRLVAYIVSQVTETQSILQQLQQRLPPYMVPAKLVRLDRLPLTNNGKIDRRALPEVSFDDGAVGYHAPRNATEKQLCDLWAQVLQQKQVGIEDNFFTLGGDSILAIQVLSQLKREGQGLGIRALFDHPTVASLAQHLNEGGDYAELAVAECQGSDVLEMARRINTHKGDTDALMAALPEVVQAELAKLKGGLSEETVMPLTPLQQGMLHATLHAEQANQYIIQTGFELRGELDTARWVASWARVWREHAVLRSRFVGLSSAYPLQQASCGEEIPWEELDWRGDNSPEGGYEGWLAAQQEKFAELEGNSLMYFSLITLDEGHWRFVWSYHHSVLDGWSKALLLEQVFTDYRGGVGSYVNGDNLPFGDYVSWLHTRDDGAAKDWWRKYLSGFDTPVHLPLLSNQPNKVGSTGLCRQFLSEEFASELGAFSRRHGVTVSTVMQAAWGVLLGRLASCQDVMYGLTVSGRSVGPAGIDGCVGPFINTVPVRLQWDNRTGFVETVKQLQDTQFSRQAHEFLGLLEVQKVSDVPTHVSMFESLFVFENYPIDTALLSEACDGLTLGDVRGLNTLDYPLVMVVQPEGDTYELQLCFAQRQLDEGDAERLLGHYRRLLSALLADDAGSLSQINWLGEADWLAIQSWNETSAPLPEGMDVVSAFASCVAAHGDKTALIEGEKAVTFSELDNWSSALAAHLQAQGLQEQATIGVYQEADTQMIASLLAVLKIGGVYVPLDKSYPKERLNYMAEDAGLSAILCLAEEPGDFAPQVSRIGVDTLDCDTALAARYQAPVIQPQQPVYIIYTSGTTGKPKGTVTTHQGYINTAVYHVHQCKITSDSRVLQFASVCFDSFMFELFQMLVGGAAYVLQGAKGKQIGKALADFIDAKQITHMTLTASVLNTISHYPLNSVQSILAGGETCSQNLMQSLTSKCQFINAYGPSEASISVCSHEFTGKEKAVPIGRPLDNLRIYVVDAQLRQVPIGVAGQIAIAGHGLGLGYINNPALTAQAFMPDPFAGDGSRLYLSGDKGVLAGDGKLYHLGRMDKQVKVNGVRIEIAEVETAIVKLEMVKTAHVIHSRSGQLVCYVVFTPGQPASVAQLKKALGQFLPTHMIPRQFVPLDDIPLTTNGKVDITGLKRLGQQEIQRDGELVALAEGDETVIAEIFSDILAQQEAIGAESDFFMLGGHSIKAIELLTQINQKFKSNIKLSEFLLAPTPRGLTSLIAERGDVDIEQAMTTRIEPDTEGRQKAFPLTEIQQAYWLGRFENPGESLSTHGYFEFDLSDKGYDHGRLERAFMYAINKHDMLRMHLNQEGQQRFSEKLTSFSIPYVDLSQLPLQKKRETIQHIRDVHSHQVFDVEVFPLFELRISRLESDKYRMHFSMDALLMDAASVGIFFSNVGTAYEQDAPLRDLDISFRDYVLSIEKYKQSEVYKQAKDYWQSRLPSLPGAPELPVKQAHQRCNTFKRFSLQITKDKWQTIQELGQSNKVTPTVMLMAAYAEVVAAWSSNDHFLLNLSLFNRYPLDPQVAELVGDFTSTTLVECNIQRDVIYQTRVKRLQTQLWQDLDNKLYSGVDVLRDLNRLAKGGLRSMMPVVFTSALGLNMAEELVEGLSQDYEIPTYGITQTSQVWIDCQVTEQNGACCINWDVLDGLFEDGVVEAMFASFSQLIQRLDVPETFWDVKLVDLPSTQLAVRKEINATECPLPEGLLHDHFLIAAKQYPDDTALVHEGETLTYREVEARALAVANALRLKHVGISEPVALIFDKGWEQHVAALATLMAGGCYVPVDASLPLDRINAYIQQSGIRIAIIADNLMNQVHFGKLDIKADNQIPINLTVQQVNPLAPVVSAAENDMPAYIIFTSGSTGMPKGVEIKHQAALNTVVDINRKFKVGPQDTVLSISAFNFDLSVYDLFGVMGCGGKVVVPGKDIAKDPCAWLALMEEQTVTVWNSVPALMTLLVEYLEAVGGSLPASLRLVMMSGDWIPVGLPARIENLGHNIEVISLGGATEASIWSIYYPIDTQREYKRSIPYGQPLANQSFYVKKPDFTDCPDWVTGEIMIGGVGLATGYRNDTAKTEQAFVNHPQTGQRLYRTGDLGRYMPDGNIEFLGRKDSQVKISGYRIELGEIETQLCKHPMVDNAVVTVRNDIGSEGKLVAYPVLSNECEDATELLGHQLASFVGNFLPEYMVPLYFVELAAIPLTANGKVDKANLPKPQVIQSTAPEGVNNARLSALCAILAELLGLSHVGSTDNFFELGGDSIVAIQLIARAKTAGILLNPRDVFENQTPEKMLAVAQVQNPQSSGHSVSILTGILAELLGLPHVGSTDNFFELGGDSIVAIQLIAKARAAGLSLNPRDVFEHQTAEKMAAVAKVEGLSAVDDATGKTGLSPIAQWFFDNNQTSRAHFNQTVVLMHNGVLATEIVEQAIVTLHEHHDVLRSRVIEEEGQFQHQIDKVSGDVKVLHIDAGDRRGQDFLNFVQGKASDSQAGFVLANGQLLLTLNIVSTHMQALVLIAHHVLVDTVSWSILLEDLQALLADPNGSLPEKTFSYRHWQQEQRDSISDKLTAQLSYWQQQVSQPVLLPVKGARGDNKAKWLSQASVSLPTAQTRLLKEQMTQSFGSNMQQVIVTALLQAVSQQYNLDGLTIKLEGHGRGTAKSDISRTVGWFTSLYPLTLNVVAGDMGQIILGVKEQLKTVPDQGEAYGILRYLADSEEVRNSLHCEQAAVTVNYLGDLGNGESLDTDWFAPILDIANQISDEYDLDSQLGLSGFISQGQLHLSLNFSTQLFDQTEIQSLALRLEQSLLALAEYVAQVQNWGFSLSDFPLLTEQGQLDTVINAFEQLSSKPKIEDAYPMTELQKGMLLVSNQQPGTGVYVIQTTLDIEDDIDHQVLMKTCAELARRHAILRTRFVGVDTPFATQVVLHQATIPVTLLDWRHLAEQDIAGHFESLRFEDWAKGFSDDDCPLTRICLIKFSNGRSRMLWTAHHSIGDGWSQSILSGEMMVIYQGIAEQSRWALPPLHSFRNYVGWLSTQDSEQSEAYWQNLMHGFAGAKSVLPARTRDSKLKTAIQSDMSWVLNREQSQLLNTLCKKHKLTLNSYVQALWSVLLARYSRRQDVVFGATVAGRPLTLDGAQQMVGPFINTLPVRAVLSQHHSLIDLSHHLIEQQNQRADFEYVSLRQIKRWAGMDNSQELFESLIVFDNYPVSELPEGVAIFHNVSQNNYPITLVVYPNKNLEFILKYDGHQYEKEQAEKLLKDFESFLLRSIADEDIELDALQLITAAASRKRDKKAKFLKIKTDKEV